MTGRYELHYSLTADDATGAALLAPRIAEHTTRRSFRRPENAAQLTGLNVTVAPEGVTIVTPTVNSSFDWRHIQRVGVSDDHVFLFNGPNQAYVIPRRLFADDADFETFADDVEQYWSDARPYEEN